MARPVRQDPIHRLCEGMMEYLEWFGIWTAAAIFGSLLGHFTYTKFLSKKTQSNNELLQKLRQLYQVENPPTD